jgi:hypothetical protein
MTTGVISHVETKCHKPCTIIFKISGHKTELFLTIIYYYYLLVVVAVVVIVAATAEVF